MIHLSRNWRKRGTRGKLHCDVKTSMSKGKVEKGQEDSAVSRGCQKVVFYSWSFLPFIVWWGHNCASKSSFRQTSKTGLFITPEWKHFSWMTVYVWSLLVWDFKLILLLCIRKVWWPKSCFMVPYLALHMRFSVDWTFQSSLTCSWVLRGWTYMA